MPNVYVTNSVLPIEATGEGLIIDRVNEVNDVRLRSYACPKVNDKGLIESWTWTRGAALLVSALSAYVSYKAAADRYEIADRYWRLARDEWDFFYDNYRPLEIKELDDIWKENPYSADYSGAIEGHVGAMDSIAMKAEDHRMNLLDKFCLCSTPALNRAFNLDAIAIKGDLENFARRWAENETTMLNDRRRNRKIAAANRGRGMLQSSTGFATKANAEFSDYADSMSNIAAGASEMFSYLGNRNPTRYNGVRNRVNNRLSFPGATPQISPTLPVNDYSMSETQDYNNADAYRGYDGLTWDDASLGPAGITDYAGNSGGLDA